MFPHQYTMTSELHAGGVTVLHRGLRKADQRPVLIKVLREEHSTPENIAMLRHELALTQRLDVPGAVRALTMEEEGPRAALILENAGGLPLTRLLHDRALDLGSALEIAAAVARILGGLHDRGIVHKQVRPESILFDASTRKTALTELGLATRVQFEPQKASAPALGETTLAYISPEQTARTNHFLDHRTDLYSLGATLYEMLIGAPPFRSMSPMDLIYSHIARRPTPVIELSPAVPRVVSDIVMKLLSKPAEDRYQTGHGLALDLEECLARLERGAEIDAFPLGRWDQSAVLRMPQRLYGRERELEALFAAFDRVKDGAVEVLVVAGHSGVGKSALVHEVYRKIGQHKGTLLSGKFDQLNRSSPYAPVAHALRGHIRHLLSEPDARLAAWRTRCQGVLGSNAQIVIDLIPELALILGEQPAVPQLGSLDAQNRFTMTLIGFLRLLAADAGPLILFLDDLQWADSATLRLLQHALRDPEMRQLLLIVAYRDNEVDATHPLSQMLAELRKAKALVSECELRHLDVRHVTALVADVLSAPEERVAPLAEAIFANTGGMPLFVSQLLTSLAKDGLLRFEPVARAWRWDLAAIRESAASEGVVDFMSKRLRRLDARTQRVLQLAACIGHRFDLETLSIIDERGPAETAGTLWDAAQEGYILPLDAEYRYFDAELRRAAPAVDAEAVKRLTFRFLHDRIQQAAYALIEGGHEREVHLRIGRLLLASKGPEPKEDDLFDVVNHLSIAAALIEDPGERTQLARLSLAAGRRAKEAAAYEAAARYIGSAAALLGEAGWTEQRDLTFEVNIELAECKYVLLASDEAEILLQELLARAATVIERAQIYNLRIVRHATLGQCASALDVGREVLALFGEDLPATEEEANAALQTELAAIESNLAGRPVESLASAPAATDATKLIEMKLLTSLLAPAYLVNPVTNVVIGLKLANLSVRCGNAPTSAAGYMTYAWYLAVLAGKSGEAYEFSQVALRLNDKFNNVELSAQLHFNLGIIGFLIRHETFCISHLEQAIRVAREVADFVVISNSVIHLFYARFSLGEDLGSLLEEIDRSLVMLRRTGDALNEHLILFTRQLVMALMGRTSDRRRLSDESFDEVDALARVERAGFRFSACWYYLVRLRLAYLFGDYNAALHAMAEADARIASALGQQFSLELPFIGSLTILAVFPGADAERRRELLASLASYEGQIVAWARQCPDNFEHRRLLIAAERARVEGRIAEAARLYEDAIEAARAGRFLPDEALAYELCTMFHAREGRATSARLWMAAAYEAYARWGASAKLAHLRETAPELASFVVERMTSAPPPLPAEPADRAARCDVAGSKAKADLIDVETVIQAAQAISSELVLDKLLDQLMRIALKNAGAQRGFLVLPSEGRLLIEASITTEPDVVRVRIGAPIEGSSELSAPIVQYVARTKEAVVLDDASGSGAFPGDAYIMSRRPRSILCVAMTHLGRLDGVFYFENNLTTAAFSPLKVELCKMMAAQAAVAVANAKLYEHVEQMTQELRQANEGLEQEVARRTEQLQETNARLEVELANSVEHERLRAVLQEQIIRAQAERLDELSTPLIPIARGVMVMPLIGTVDTRRAQQVLTASLQGAQGNAARRVILDVTGVRTIDDSFARVLVETASALRLVGTETILTGIRPKVAQALVELGADLGALVTMSTLQSGVAYALRR